MMYESHTYSPVGQYIITETLKLIPQILHSDTSLLPSKTQINLSSLERDQFAYLLNIAVDITNHRDVFDLWENRFVQTMYAEFMYRSMDEAVANESDTAIIEFSEEERKIVTSLANWQVDIFRKCLPSDFEFEHYATNFFNDWQKRAISGYQIES